MKVVAMTIMVRMSTFLVKVTAGTRNNVLPRDSISSNRCRRVASASPPQKGPLRRLTMGLTPPSIPICWPVSPISRKYSGRKGP